MEEGIEAPSHQGIEGKGDWGIVLAARENKQPEGLLVSSRVWRRPQADDTPGQGPLERPLGARLCSLKGCPSVAGA